MRRPESSSISPSVRDALAVIHQQALELIVHGASLDTVLLPWLAVVAVLRGAQIGRAHV